MDSYQNSIEQMLWPEKRDKDEVLGDKIPGKIDRTTQRSFQNSIEQMLWPEKRDKDRVLADKVPGVIDRTTTTSYLRVPKGYLPEFLQDIIELEEHIIPDDKGVPLFKETGLEVGPIPKGTPVNLLANLNMMPDDANILERFAHRKQLVKLLIKIKKALKALPDNATDEQATQVFLQQGLADELLALSKCDDFVVNRGHYFGTNFLNQAENEPGLSDGDKRALIEFLKTF